MTESRSAYSSVSGGVIKIPRKRGMTIIQFTGPYICSVSYPHGNHHHIRCHFTSLIMHCKNKPQLSYCFLRCPFETRNWVCLSVSFFWGGGGERGGGHLRTIAWIEVVLFFFSRLKSNCTLSRAKSLINMVCTGSQGDITLSACL